MIKALVFDVFGTVVDWRSSVISECKILEKKTGVLGDWENEGSCSKVCGTGTVKQVRKIKIEPKSYPEVN